MTFRIFGLGIVAVLYAGLSMATAFAAAPPFDARDADRLGTQAVRELSRCRSLKGVNKLWLGELANRTDEHIDKTMLTDILTRKLKGAGWILLKPGAPHAKDVPGLAAQLSSEKTENGPHFQATYRLDLQIRRGPQELCRKQTLIKKRH
jgi:hypothetical protein